MQITANTKRLRSVHSSGASAQSIESAQAEQAVRMAASVSQLYQPSQPHVLTEDLKAQLAAANQQRRANLYPRLAQTLATIEPGQAPQSYSEQRAMSLQQLAAANKARRSSLREAGYALPAAGMT